MITLIYCNNKNFFTRSHKSKLWNFFITNKICEFENYLSIYRPKTIIVSERVSDKLPLIMSLINKHYAQFPFLQVLSDASILDLILDNHNNLKIFKPERIPHELDNLINGFLLDYGLQPHLKGFTYIKMCMCEAIKNEAVFTNAKKSLYANIAQMYRTTITSVERNMSFSISKAYPNSKKLKELFDNKAEAPSNLLFLKKLFIVMKSVINLPIYWWIYIHNSKASTENTI